MGYLGDIGPGNATSFSFFVPAETEFVLVTQEVQPFGASEPGLAVGCSYSYTVLLDCPTENFFESHIFSESNHLCERTGCIDGADSIGLTRARAQDNGG